MVIAYGAVPLAPGGLEGEPFEVSPAGGQVVDPAEFFRATSATIFGRDNRTIDWTFKVWRQFSTLADAQAFQFLHFADLPANGDIVITCGAPGETPRTVKQAGAAVEAMPLRPAGRSVLVQYNVRGGLFVEVT